MNCQKYTRNQASNILVHCNRSDPTRTYANEKIEPSKSHLNYNLAPYREISDFEFMKKRCEELNIFKRKDINWMVSWLVTMPQDYKGNKEDFFDKSYEYLTGKYGEENVISAYVHMDETTPHLHFCFVPVVYDTRKETYKVNAKQCITKSELQKIHSDMQNYLEKQLYTNVNLLNGATKEGNKNVQQLKATTEIKEKAIKELVENPTTEIIEKVIDAQIKKYNNQTPIKPISIKPLTEVEVEKLNKKDSRNELKIKIQEVNQLKEQNNQLFYENNNYSNSLYLAKNMKNKSDRLEDEIIDLKDTNYFLKSEIQKINKKYNKLEDVFYYFITRIQNLFFNLSNIFNPVQKNNNKEDFDKLNYISKTEPKTIINNIEEDFDNTVRERKRQERKHNHDYDMEM